MQWSSQSIQLLRCNGRPGINRIKSKEQITLNPRSKHLDQSELFLNKNGEVEDSEAPAVEVFMMKNIAIKPGNCAAKTLSSETDSLQSCTENQYWWSADRRANQPNLY